MVSPLFYLMAAAMVLMALASYRYNKILFLVEGTAAVLSGLAVLVSDVLYRRNISTTVRSAKRVLTGEEEAAFQAFALPVAVVAPAGDIVWANEAFAGSLCGGRNFLGDNVLKYIPQDLPPGDGRAGHLCLPQRPGVHGLRRPGQGGVDPLLCGRHLF